MSTEPDDEWDMDAVGNTVEQLVETVNTLSAAVTCILVTLNREGIALAKPDAVTIN